MARLASRYAAALYGLAVENKKIDSYYEQVTELKKVFCDDREISEFMNSPNLSSEEKFSIIKKAVEGKADDELLGLISVVFTKNRQKELGNIFDEFTAMVLENKGIVTAYVESAVPLSDRQLNDIKTKLSDNLNKQIIIRPSVDKGLIGGVRIAVDGHVIDGTIKKSIEDMRRKLLENRLV